MSAAITLHPEAVTQRDGVVEWSAALEELDMERRSLWFRTDEAGAEHLAPLADGFVLACLFYAMRRGKTLRVRAKVSPLLLRNLHEYQTAWSRWLPDRYQMVDIEPDGFASEPAGGSASRALCAFSGGLDSCFTVWRHTRMLTPNLRQPLNTALMAHGLDIPFWEPEVFQRAAAKAQRILDSVGMPMLTVATNMRILDDNWDDAHGAGVAACLHSMSAKHGVALIPGTHAYEALRIPFGSNPVTDPLLSSQRLAIAYDGAGFSRVEKARIVSDWPAALQGARVCWAGPNLDRNCGACEKCVAFGICFAVNELPLPPCLPIADLATAIRFVWDRPLTPPGVQRMDERLALAKERGIDAPWVAALQEWRRRSVASWSPTNARGRLLPDSLWRRLAAHWSRRRNP